MRHIILFILFICSVRNSPLIEGDLPLYLAIQADTEIVKPQIKDLIEKSVEEIKKKYGSHVDFSNHSFKEPDNYHVTTFYIGNNHSLVNSEYFKSFQNDLIFKIPIQAVFYVPNKIITAPVTFDSYPIKIQNKYSHITLRTGEWSAKNSNDLLEGLFNPGGPLHEAQFLGVFSNPKTNLVIRIPHFEILGEKVDVYIIKIPKNAFEIEAESMSEYE